MVRLKGCSFAVKVHHILKFQFHNGPIKRLQDLSHRGTPPEFQFHNGPIKRKQQQQKTE